MIWNTLILAGDINSGKTTIFNLLLDKNEQPVPSQSVEYQYIKKKDELILELYTCDANTVAMITQQDRKYILVFVVDLSSKRVDFSKFAEIKNKYPNFEYLTVGTKLDAFLNIEKELQKSILTCFQLSCRKFGTPFLFSSPRHPQHLRYLKSYLLHKGLENDKPDVIPDEYKPEFDISEPSAKQLKSLEMALSKLENIATASVQPCVLAPEPDVDSYCLHVQERLKDLIEKDKKEIDLKMEHLSDIQPFDKKWDEIFALLSL